MFGTRHQELTAETRRRSGGDFVELAAGVTHYELRGDEEAETVVLVHGNAAPSATWDYTIGPLCDAGFRVLRYDIFGHGLSDRPALRTYDRRLYTAQLQDLLQRLDVALPVGLVGSSQGGSIAACFAAEHPEAASRVALLAPLFDDFTGSGNPIIRALTMPVVGEVLLRLLPESRLADPSDAVVSPTVAADLRPRAAAQFQFRGKRRAILANARGDAMQGSAACYRRLAQQGIPVLLAYGSLDRRVPRASMNRLRAALPGIEYHELEGAGHLAHYEFPDRVNPLLAEFLGR